MRTELHFRREGFQQIFPDAEIFDSGGTAICGLRVGNRNLNWE
jgi:hypothetical protein